MIDGYGNATSGLNLYKALGRVGFGGWADLECAGLAVRDRRGGVGFRRGHDGLVDRLVDRGRLRVLAPHSAARLVARANAQQDEGPAAALRVLDSGGAGAHAGREQDSTGGRMGSLGLERTFAMVAGAILIVLGLAGSVGNPFVGRPDTTGIIVTGFGHDLVHLVCGALFLHVGVALNGRQRLGERTRRNHIAVAVHVAEDSAISDDLALVARHRFKLELRAKNTLV
jgi:hypothetical protein